MWTKLLLPAIVVVGLTSSAVAQPAPRTFCNPLDLNYGFFQRGERIVRHGADPVIVLYKDRYYLFSSWENAGYRVSDDLLSWRYIPFAPGVLAGSDYVAAAVAVIDGAIYFSELGSARKPPVGLWRTTDPDSGKWENVRQTIPLYADPTLFVDPPSGRVFLYHGLEKPIRGVELDHKTFVEIPGTDTQLMPPFDLKTLDGWEICTWDNNEASPPMRSNNTFNPCREGSWMTYFNGTYYLQYASPGTTVPGYADGVLTSDTPLGPFTYQPYSPISHKLTGFITSAGHSCLFQDRHGNWWRATTMLIGVNHRFERRLGLFPAGFDKDGVPYTRTDLGEAPITLATGPRDHAGNVGTDWVVVSDGMPVTASSTLKDHGPEMAADEDVRTWWSAETGNAGEWMQIDLGAERELLAVQVNLAEQDVRPVDDPADDVHRYMLSVSIDGMKWSTALDRSAATTAAPHAYAQFGKPIRARYVKLQNVHMPRNGTFAVSDLRLFAAPYGDAPKPVETLTAKRDEKDRRKVTLSWSTSTGAAGYVIRYGIDANRLNLHHRVRGGDAREVTFYNLNHAPPYHFRIEAVNDGGVTASPAAAAAP